jgi:hypothetical protein
MAHSMSRDAVLLPMSRARMREMPAAKGDAGRENCVRSSRCHEFVVAEPYAPL